MYLVDSRILHYWPSLCNFNLTTILWNNPSQLYIKASVKSFEIKPIVFHLDSKSLTFIIEAGSLKEATGHSTK
jgi:hypothetical protein